MSVDWTKNGGVRAVCFNDPSWLTAFGNDLGFENVFAYPVSRFVCAGDILFAISSSGKSLDILNAVNVANTTVITFSGFAPDNPLRRMGAFNFYVPSSDYGLVECSHLILCHEILNRAVSLRSLLSPLKTKWQNDLNEEK
jgi:D-sedoheptulose 7-phosphate isomerase